MVPSPKPSIRRIALSRDGIGPRTYLWTRRTGVSSVSIKYNINTLLSPILVHAGRDRILLGGEHSSDDEGDEDEVFALKGMPEDSESDDSEDEDDILDDDDPYKNLPSASVEDTKTKSKKDKAKKSKKGKAVESDEEREESEEEEEGWGRKKSEYYASNDAQIESDDEEAHEMEEQEAKRLQTKTRDGLADDDFGLDDMAEGAAEVFDEWVPLRNHNPCRIGSTMLTLIIVFLQNHRSLSSNLFPRIRRVF